MTREGFPVIDGLRPFLAGVRALFGWRDHLARAVDLPQALAASAVQGARASLAGREGLDESGALQLLADFGLPVNPGIVVLSEAEAVQAAATLGYPVVVKTANPEIQHKAAQDGVRLDLRDGPAVAAAWRQLSARLGPRVLVAPMVASGGLELALGMVRDAQFGPLVMIGFGGARLEALADVVFAMPPFGPDGARRQLARLRHQELLRCARADGTPDLDAFCRMAARFSAVVVALGDELQELDLNPVIVNAEGCIAVDALLVGEHQYNRQTQTESTP